MNNDTEKADEILRREIERLDYKGLSLTAEYILLETILKDREALRRVLVASDSDKPTYLISQQALASQTETIIKTLS